MEEHDRGVYVQSEVVIFEHPKHVAKFGFWDEHDAHPVMNDATRTSDELSALERLPFFHLDFTALEPGVSFGALWRMQFVNPQRVRCAFQLFFLPRLRQFRVAVERGARIRM